MPAISTLRDNFSDNAQALVWHLGGSSGSATQAETGGQAVFTLPSSAGVGPHEAYWKTQPVYDLTADSFFINIGTMVATGVAATAYYRLYLDDNDYVQWTQTSGTLKAQKVVAGVVTDLYSVAWSSTTYKYLRIRESGGSILFDSSSNGTTWTNRATTTVASTFAVTALGVWFGASCGNVASPGSFRLDDVNLLLPALTTTWRWTEVEWPLFYRFKSITVAGTNGVGYLATSPDGTTWRYFAGPAGSKGSASIQLTEQSQANAEIMAVDLPADGRWDLPTIVECRFIRLYHRSKSGSYTLYEYYPRRLVQSDDIEAESIRAINIAAASITADRLSVVSLSAITANLGTVTAGTIDGATIYAGGQRVKLDAFGLKLVAGNRPSLEYEEVARIDWKLSGGTFVGWVGAVYDNSQGAAVLALGIDDPISATAPVWIYNTIVQFNTPVKASNGLNVGTATGAVNGEIKATGEIDTVITDAVTAATSSMLRLRHLSTGTPATAFGGDISINLESASGTERQAAIIRSQWATATDASRASLLRFYVYDAAAARDALTLQASGSAAMIGFLGASPVARQVVSGSRATDTWRQSVMTALVNLGLITNSSTA